MNKVSALSELSNAVLVWNAVQMTEILGARHDERRARRREGHRPDLAASFDSTDSAVTLFMIFAAGGRSVHRETVHLVFLVELFGEQATREAMTEVMTTGHVGAEYVEHVLRHKKGLTPSAAPLRQSQNLRTVNSYLTPISCDKQRRRRRIATSA